VGQPIVRTIFPDLKTDLPVLLLHNLDRSWPQIDIDTCLELGELMFEGLRSAGHPVVKERLENDQLASLLSGYNPNELIVFNWCEEVPGIPRSSWMVAQELERQGFTYTGADYPSLVFSQDKRQVQQRLKEAGVPTPIWRIFYSLDEVRWDLFPAIVKPAFEHYSLGIARESVVETLDELTHRVAYVLEQHEQPTLVEEFIDGREFHVGVVGNGSLQMLPPAEIDFSIYMDIHDRLCTYEANFVLTSYAYQNSFAKLPVHFSDEELSLLEKAVLGAYRATGCRDYARMDVRLRDGNFYILDVNHNADLSPDNSLIQAAEMIGYPYGYFASLLVNLAAERHPVFGNGMKTSPQTQAVPLSVKNRRRKASEAVFPSEL
jgi:D-alanine-D-alanine ligase